MLQRGNHSTGSRHEKAGPKPRCVTIRKRSEVSQAKKVGGGVRDSIVNRNLGRAIILRDSAAEAK
jgi:hypothetical protein